MLNFNWNISSWLWKMLPLERKTEIHYSWLKALFSPLQTVQNEFAAKCIDLDFRVKYNSQQLVLKSLLNRLFDPSTKRIRVETIADLAPDVILYFDAESVEAPVLYHDSETAGAPVLYHDSEESEYDYRILVPADLSAFDSQIISWVSLYNTSGKKFQIVHF